MVGICFSAHEVRALMQGRLSKIMRPQKKWGGLVEPCKCIVGQVYFVKETWLGPKGHCLSAASMPESMARFHVKVISVTLEKVIRLTDENTYQFGYDYADYDFGDNDDMGLVDVMEDDWNKRYGKKHPWATSWAWSIEIKKGANLNGRS